MQLCQSQLTPVHKGQSIIVMVSTGGYNHKLQDLLIYKFSCFFGPQVVHAFQCNEITMKVGEWCDSPNLINVT